MTTFRRLGLLERLLEIAFPPLRARRERRIEEEIRRLCREGLHDEVRFR